MIDGREAQIDWYKNAADCKTKAELKAAIGHLVESAWPYNAAFGYGYIVLNRGNYGDNDVEWCLDPVRVKLNLDYEISRLSTDPYIFAVEFAQMITGFRATLEFLRGIMVIPLSLRENW